MSNPTPATPAAEPWWRVKMLWLVIGGPLAVVIAGFVTLGLALKNPDPVLERPPVSAGPEGTTDAAHTPAMQARNHAATGGTAPAAK
ncbi:MAG: hypothetical protein L6Q75_20085 [Burkholderiaceae bacterium]|nr:hypothetical protein [Burkholderiaceae bacterium]